MPLTPTITLQRKAISFDPDIYSWKPLRLLGIYRIFLALVFLLTFISDLAPQLLGGAHPRLFLITAGVYLFASIVLVVLCLRRRPPFDTQVYLHTYLDIFTLILLMHASGGVESGLGMLLLVTVTSGGVLMPGRMAVWFASLATLGIFCQQFYVQLTLGPAATAYPQAGILGATLFVTSILSVFLTRKGRESAELAELRGIDLENLAELNEHIIEQMDSGILVVDAKGRLRVANGSARIMLALPDNGRSSPLIAVAPRLAYSLQAWKENPNQPPLSIKEPESPAELSPQFIALGNQGTLVFLEDRSLLSQQLQQLKLASLGRLTASIAHEIRNPLGAISHASQLLGESTHLDHTDQRFTEIIIEQCKRMNSIIEDVLQLSRAGKAHADQLDLLQELPQIHRQFLSSESVPETYIELRLSEHATLVYIDANHLRQVIWNLWRNALQHGKGNDPERQVIIITSIGRLVDTGHIYLDVHDNGCGIPVELVEEIFEPFFTSSHKGTGLGLFLARELCEFNNASLSYRPTSVGTCFRITFNRHTP